MIEQLDGGRDHIYKKEDCVHRPSEAWTEHIHLFLKYLHDQGFDKIPYPYGITDGIEQVSYVKGDVHNGLLPNEVKSDQALISLAELLKTYHDFGSDYITNLTGKEIWMLPVREPAETMCHGDFAPYNIAMDGHKAVGIIDFDTLHPGPRIWDIAYVLYRWVPLMSPDNIESFGTEEDKLRRVAVFKAAYGCKEFSGEQLIKWVIKRLDYIVTFISDEAQKGNETFQKNIDDGHLKTYLMDLNYLRNHSLNHK